MKSRTIGRKLTSILLALVLILQIIPTFSVVKAAETDWTGYTAISDKAGLNAVRNNLNGMYYLTTDIEFTAADFISGGDFYNGGAGWSPIGANDTNAFSGTFDGDGHTITGLNCDINSTTTAYGGFIGCNSGSVKNVGLVNGSIFVTTTGSLAYSYAGGVAGYNSSGTIINCFNTGSVSSSSYSSFFDSYSGGIAGRNYGTISNCYNSGNVSATTTYSSNVGGIAGYNYYGTISNCYNTGSVSTYAEFPNAGGIVGNSSTSTISNCYNTGSVVSTTSSSGLKPSAGGIAGCTSDGTISNCYNTGSVKGNVFGSSYVGGIVGYITSGAITKCYYLNIVTKGMGNGIDTTYALTSQQIGRAHV